MSVSDVAGIVESYHRAVDAFVNGDAELEKRLFSHCDDVTLANPFGPAARGWNAVERALDHAASLIGDAEPVRFERIADYATPDLAFILEIERTRMRIGGANDTARVSLRVTTIFRPEDGAWKVIHRHADPITDDRPPESVIERSDD